MNSFTYNGINSADMGLRIEKKNAFSSPKYDVSFQEVPGRNGDLILPGGRYPNVQITYTVFISFYYDSTAGNYDIKYEQYTLEHHIG